MKHSTGRTLNIKYRPFFFLGLLAFLFTAQPVLAAEESNDEWKYHGSIYLWASDIHLQDTEGNNDTISFNDIVETLDIVVMGGLGARKDKFGFQIDAIYLDTTDSDNNTLTPGVTLTDVELEAIILTPMATYRVVDDGQINLPLLGRICSLYMDLNLKFDPLSDIRDHASTTDVIIGFRLYIQLN